MPRHRRGRRVPWARALAVVLVVGCVLALALLVRGFGGTGPDDVALPPSSSAPASSAPAPRTSSGPGVVARRYAVPGTGATVTLGAQTGLVIDARGQHRLTATVSSSAPLYEVGYLIPTSLDHSYGKAMRPGARWSVTTTVTGAPYYAVIWVWAGASGAPATCTIALDGKVRVSRTTSGPYGRQVCYA